MLGMVSMPNETVGVEGAGVVTRVGDSKCTFVPGEHAFGWIGRDFCSHSMSPLSAMLHSPAHLSQEEIATMSTAWITVDHAFGSLCANVSFDTTILIHTATGSVGIAALWLAQNVDARVVATAGQDRKRAWLTGQAAPMISTSRDPEQFNSDLELWFGKLSQPLTTTLNALSGEFIRISLCHLASGGAFAELGKPERSSVVSS
jgi:phthiocerol/phenolphthiocerol synthesis type-I polyketide synthase C